MKGANRKSEEKHAFRVDSCVVPIAVREAVATLHKGMAFDPREFMARSGITANIGLYQQVTGDDHEGS